jgi:hypothetical protein
VTVADTTLIDRYRLAGGLVTVSGNVTGSVNDDPAHASRGIVRGIAYSSLPDGATILSATLAYSRYATKFSKVVS